MDIWSKQKRSRVMARIRSRDTSPELAIRRRLHSLGLRYVLGGRHLPGRPDIVFPRWRLAVFIHGCFWHQHPGCIDGRLPHTRRSYWVPKLKGNIVRDARARRRLSRMGWRVVRIWECEIHKRPLRGLRRILRVISQRGSPSLRCRAGAALSRCI